MKRSADHSSMPKPDFGPQHGDTICLRCPPTFLPAVKWAAGQRETSASAYMRQAIADQLRRDGVDLSSSEAA
jgi:hypothetical protein